MKYYIISENAFGNYFMLMIMAANLPAFILHQILFFTYIIRHTYIIMYNSNNLKKAYRI